jgi:cytochrome b6-f complex iron-sulfur subunit
MATDQTRKGLFYPREGAGGLVLEGGPAEVAERRGISRRLLLRWTGWGLLLALIGQWLYGFVLGFFWPKKTGAFGGDVTAGNVNDFQVGDVVRVQEGRFYLSRVPEGFVALWWKCPHLGCTVPWKPEDPTEDAIKDKGRFNCPCHGSIYDRYGQIIRGPAPRPMDAFKVRIEGGKVVVATGPQNVIMRDRSNPREGVVRV